MENIAILTLKEPEYKALLSTLKYLKIEPISVKILPDDSELRQTNSIYGNALKERKKIDKLLEDIRYNSKH